MKNKIKKNIVKGIGNICPKCGENMERREHGKITNKIREKIYYFSEWDYCLKCKHVQHYEEFKVVNNFMNSLQVFKEDQDSLFKSFKND